jgi:putative DNA methylase
MRFSICSGGAIPLEALRLGCEAYALDLNPVAHLIELCTLVYPQQYGAPDRSAIGCAEDGTWAGLAAEVEHWGEWALERVRDEIGDLYPPIPDPCHSERSEESPAQLSMDLTVKESRASYDAKAGMLTPVAYLWTRTVRCKNPACGGTVPLARQTWLRRRKGQYIAVRPNPEVNRDESPGKKLVRYELIEATTQKELGFNPSQGSRGGNVPCPFCGTVADSDYVKIEGQKGQIGVQPMAVVCAEPKGRGKVYLSASDVPPVTWVKDDDVLQRIRALATETGLTVPSEEIIGKSGDQVPNYGMVRYGDLFLPRQRLLLLVITKYIRQAYSSMTRDSYESEHAKAITAYLGLCLDRVANYQSTLCIWRSNRTCVLPTFSRQALAMVWDFGEMNPFGGSAGDWLGSVKWVAHTIRVAAKINLAASVERGSATQLPYNDINFDAIITDPPYYDNVIYADLADFFYVWLKRSIGDVYSQHFGSLSTPKKKEAVSSPFRHATTSEASSFYETLMTESFHQARRVLKSKGPMVIVYAHKTTAGWATLVDALQDSGFVVTEAWPLDTEMVGGMRADTASLASSIFLVARRREGEETGSYERDVRPDLQKIVRERVERLWAQGVTGADLVIACVGAGLRAFTRYACVEYANGEPVPADSFLAEVEGVVLETLLEKLFGVSQAGVGSVDPITRFYVLYRYAYRHATIDAGEAIVFAYPQHVELDGPGGLSTGSNPLVEKKKGKYRLRDFTERGEDEDLGMPHEGEMAPLVDVLHRLLWLVEHIPAEIPAYLDEARPDVERLRLVAQTLAGQTLAGNGSDGGRALVAAQGAEASALRKLTTNWRTLVEAHRGPMV